jgi:hypothetical protein
LHTLKTCYHGEELKAIGILEPSFENVLKHKEKLIPARYLGNCINLSDQQDTNFDIATWHFNFCEYMKNKMLSPRTVLQSLAQFPIIKSQQFGNVRLIVFQYLIKLGLLGLLRKRATLYFSI